MSTNYVGNVQAISAPVLNNYINRIINGGMDIDQRNEGASTVSIYIPLNTTVHQYAADRMVWSVSKKASGVQGVNDSIITEKVSLSGLGAAIPVELLPITSATKFEVNVDNFGYGGANIFAGTGSGNEVYFRQLIEPTMIADLSWGTAAGKPISISFWYMTEVSPSKTLPAQRFNVFVKNDPNASVPIVYRVAVDTPTQSTQWGTWRRVIVNIPPPPVGSEWGGKVQIGLCMFDRTATTNTLNAWDTVSTSYGATSTNAVNLFLTGVDTSDYPNCWFYLTGLQVQEGGATPFEYRPSFEEIKLCERYYEKSYTQGVKVGTITNQNCVMLSHLTTGGGYMFVRLKTAKQPNTTIANTQVVIYNPAVLNTTGSGRNFTAGTNNTAVVVANAQGHESLNIQFTTNATLGQQIGFHYVVNVDYI